MITDFITSKKSATVRLVIIFGGMVSRRHPHHSRNRLISNQGKCRAPWMSKNETHQYKIQMLARRDHEPRRMVAKVGKKHNVADGLTKSVNQQVPSDMLTTLKSMCPSNMIVVKSIQKELMGEQNSTRGAGGVNPNAGHTNIVKDEKEKLENRCGHRDTLPRELRKFRELRHPSKCWAQERRIAEKTCRTLRGIAWKSWEMKKIKHW